jgi:hypothetical protein
VAALTDDQECRARRCSDVPGRSRNSESSSSGPQRMAAFAMMLVAVRLELAFWLFLLLHSWPGCPVDSLARVRSNGTPMPGRGRRSSAAQPNVVLGGVAAGMARLECVRWSSWVS